MDGQSEYLSNLEKRYERVKKQQAKIQHIKKYLETLPPGERQLLVECMAWHVQTLQKEHSRG